MLREKKRRRIGHALQAPFGHGEDAELVRSAKAILDGADKAKARMSVAFEVQDGVDDVLEHARSRDRSLLGDVPDEDDGRCALFGHSRQLRSALAHLRDAPWR